MTTKLTQNEAVYATPLTSLTSLTLSPSNHVFGNSR